MKGRLKGLDGLRGILALAVAYSHAFGHILGWNNLYSPIGNGSYAVDVFFIMSGIVLYHAYHKRFIFSNHPALEFLKVRFWRLWPMHFFTIILVFLSFLITKGILLPNWIKLDSIYGGVLDITLFSSIGIFGDNGAINQPSWSISVEMWFGFVLMLCIFKNWLSSIPVILVATMVFIYGDVSVKGGADPIYFAISSGGWRCLLGMSLGILSYKIAEKWFFRLPAGYLNVMAGTTFVIIMAIIIGVKLTGIVYVSVTILISLLIMSIPLSTGWVFQFLEASPIHRVGELSYSLYLIHTPIIYFFWVSGFSC